MLAAPEVRTAPAGEGRLSGSEPCDLLGRSGRDCELAR